MEDRFTPVRLIAAMLVIGMLLLWLSLRFNGLPLIGELPGDIEFDLPGGAIYLPLATSILLGLLLTLVALAIQKLSRK
jgi:ABC-type amino acid transport system permease subunit